MATLKLLSFCLLLELLHSSSPAKKDTCDGFSIRRCTECIQQGPPCAWCTDPEPDNMPRCDTPEGLRKAGCAAEHIYHPESSLRVVRNHPRDDQADVQQVFLQPQEVNITLWPGAPQSFNIKIFSPEDQLTSPPPPLVLNFSSVPEGINITYTTLSTQNPLDVQVDVELTQCPSEKHQNRTMTVHMTPRDSSLSLDLHLTLECSCECASERVESSPACSGRGARECGGCQCDMPYLGGRCQFSAFDAFNEDGCRPGPNSEACSGRGDCMFGSCECKRRANPQERYTGMYCECSNFNCPRANNRLCGGHGRCECDVCHCDANWTGTDCSCSLNTSSCVATNGQICNGRGNCECGRCRCTNNKFQGPTCEVCPTCPGACAEHKECVECRAFGTRTNTDEYRRCLLECEYLNVTMVDSRDDLFPPGVTDPMRTLCKERDWNDCWYYFSITRTRNFQARVIRNKECP